MSDKKKNPYGLDDALYNNLEQLKRKYASHDDDDDDELIPEPSAPAQEKDTYAISRPAGSDEPEPFDEDDPEDTDDIRTVSYEEAELEEPERIEDDLSLYDDDDDEFGDLDDDEDEKKPKKSKKNSEPDEPLSEEEQAQRAAKAKKAKRLRIIIAAVAIPVVLWLTMFFTDMILMYKWYSPFFCIETTVYENGSRSYVGLFYKIQFHVDENGNINGEDLPWFADGPNDVSAP